MSFTSPSTPNPVSPPVSPPPHPNSAEMTVDAPIDELASTIEEPPLGVLLARFLEVHGDSGQRTHFTLPSEQWRNIAEKIEASTNSTVALIKLNALDEQDQQELDQLELGEFLRKQPQLPGPSASSSLPLPSPSVMATRRMLAKRRKRSVQQEEGGSSWHKHPVEEVSELDVVPKAHNCKRKHPVGGRRDAEIPDYCRVVVDLRPHFVDTPALATLSGGPINETMHLRELGDSLGLFRREVKAYIGSYRQLERQQMRVQEVNKGTSRNLGNMRQVPYACWGSRQDVQLIWEVSGGMVGDVAEQLGGFRRRHIQSNWGVRG
ncbi:hypothetical protein F5877DRAFT_70274 [Lentinula edodes]|nr:hypothetical protein F5877DRAFT_70274 [Lentinula edodes]